MAVQYFEAIDDETYDRFAEIYGYSDPNDPNERADILITRGLDKDYEWDINEKPSPDDKVNEKGEGTRIYEKLHNGKNPHSLIGKNFAITVHQPAFYKNATLTNQDVDYSGYDYHTKFQKFSDLCDPEKFGSEELRQKPNFEYYPEDFMYSQFMSYPLNRMITLRRFPYACVDNISDPNVQPERDVTRMVTHFNNEVNKLEDILGFSYGLRWKQMEAQMETAQMYGGDQEGLTGFLKQGALAMGDSELIKNRLRGPVGNEVNPTADTKRVYGPVDSITTTHIRDVGFDFEKEFSIEFTYRARSIGGRNPDSIMKDIISNILLCTYNDGEFWPGSRFWIGARPSKLTNHLKWMNSDDPNKILEGAYQSMKDFVKAKMNPGGAMETLKEIMKGGIQMAMANFMNKIGRPGMIYGNSLLSGDPIGMWHLTIGHPMNPILTMGDLICTGVDITFPDDTLSFGDFPTSLKAVVKLKPAKPRDRAGIEMMFNHGQKRIYSPAVIKVVRSPKINDTKRGLWDKHVADRLDAVTVETVKDGSKKVVNETTKVARKVTDNLSHSVSVGLKYAQSRPNDDVVLVHNVKPKNAVKLPDGKLGSALIEVVDGSTSASDDIH